MTRPTRATVAGRAFLDLRARASADSRPVDEYLTLYALEGFLDRLSKSRHRDRFVLKGGVLLAAHDARQGDQGPRDDGRRELMTDRGVGTTPRLVQGRPAVSNPQALAWFRRPVSVVGGDASPECWPRSA